MGELLVSFQFTFFLQVFSENCFCFGDITKIVRWFWALLVENLGHVSSRGTLINSPMKVVDKLVQVVIGKVGKIVLST